MSRRAAPILLAVLLLLSACSQQAPVAATTPQPVATTAPTAASQLGGLGAGVPTAQPTSPAKAAPTYTVQRGTIENTLAFSAQVAPAQASMSFTQDGVLVKLYVRPGQALKAGDLVAQLDLGELESQLREATLAAEQARRALGQAAQASQLEVQQAQLLLDAAQIDLAKIKAPPTPLALAQAQVAVRQAQSNLDTVRNNASQAKNQAKQTMEKAIIDLQALKDQRAESVAKLAKAKASTDQKDLKDKIEKLDAAIRDGAAAVSRAAIDFDTARNNEVAEVNDAQAKLDLARAELDALLRGADQFAVAEKERAVRAAELGVAQARQRGTPDPALTSAVESGRLRIEQLNEQIAARQLYAPIGGEIASIAIKPGDPVQIGSPVITLIDRSRLELVASGSDLLADGRTALPQISPSQQIAITFSRYPNQSFSGALSQAPDSASAGAAADSRYAFSFDPQGRSFDPGDLATLSLSLGRKYDALYLPLKAVRLTRDRASVILRANGEDKRTDVIVGITTADKVEILSGLKEGDLVVGE
jgi:multidrug resistance efflux pump